MPTSPELQAKIDALEDEGLKARILHVLARPVKRQATDEEVYDSIVSDHATGKEQQAKLKKCRDDEVAAFARHFMRKNPEYYAEFVRQEKNFNEIEEGLAWDVYRLIWEWIPDMSRADARGLFGKFRDYVRTISDHSNVIE